MKVSDPKKILENALADPTGGRMNPISKELRRTATEDSNPITSCNEDAWLKMCEFVTGEEWLSDWSTTELRVFMLLVAEALE